MTNIRFYRFPEEGEKFELKRDISAPKRIMKTIGTYANTAGGTIITGRWYNGDIIGVEDLLLAADRLDVLNIVSYLLR